MIIKNYLYASRCLNTWPLIAQLVQKFKKVREVERNIHWDRDQDNKLKQKW